MTTERRAGIYVVLAVVWLGVIAFFSLSPSPPGAMALRQVIEWLPGPRVTLRFAQAVIHGILFGVWAIVCAMIVVSLSPASPPRMIVLVSVGAVIAVGVTIEIVQNWIPKRSPSLTDFAGDVAGALVVLAVLYRRRAGPFRTRSSHVPAQEKREARRPGDR